ncbi:TetR family transcriptional regulator [Brevibacillus reuszeri]|uniref:TetR family transcriptional regulator n=1 Tax=Brevibacillus reuszeri TaxID=54915 RepID=A0A0K9Z0F1_9BACL|nr:TetR family transcriptional regulator [Brevibacillus reuszeri]KNB74434.1 TetR family transcriptional regulator [Brevibacillus reuszeri]MED1856353.1 TetR family transcriptional regulator [Brevibacillus reuszeri]GED67952.1 TetR family transcriptional regulator [Brevibacillus reuszeri]
MSPKVSDKYKNEKKKALLQAAKRVFLTKGYTKATMQDVMDEAGISRGALYSYFDNVEHLYRELLQFEDQQDVLFFSPNDDETSWQKITNWVHKQQKEMEQIEQTLTQANSEYFLSIRDVKKQESNSYSTTRYDRIVDALTVLFQSGTKKGELQPRLPAEMISRYLVTFIDGLMLDTAHLGAEKTKVAEQVEALVFSLREMLGPASEK